MSGEVDSVDDFATEMQWEPGRGKFETVCTGEAAQVDEVVVAIVVAPAARRRHGTDVDGAACHMRKAPSHVERMEREGQRRKRREEEERRGEEKERRRRGAGRRGEERGGAERRAVG